MNAAQQIHRALGVAVTLDSKPEPRNAHYTKAGPGREHNFERVVKTLKQKRAGAFGRGLRNWCNGKASKGRV